MSVANALLPLGFKALEPFARSWALANAAQRAERRTKSSEDERIAFHAAAKDLLAPALAYLDQTPLKTFDEKQQCLMNLMLSFAHVAQAVELQRDNETRHAKLRAALKITRASADSP